MRRREFISLIGSAAAWPLAAWAQDTRPALLVGVLMATIADEDQQLGLEAFVEALKQLGWVEGRNVRFDIRWGQARATETARHAAELAALAPDIIFADGTAALQSLLRGGPVPFQSCSATSPIRSAPA